MKELPTAITTCAFRSRGGTGEYAWRREDLAGVFAALAEAGCAILGGEVWGVHENSIYGLLPLACPAVPGMHAVADWDTRPRAIDEAWSIYCRRTATESLEGVGKGPLADVERVVHPDFPGTSWFNVCFVSEDEWREIDRASKLGSKDA